MNPLIISLHLFHLIVFITVLIGWYIFPNSYLPMYLMVLPALIISWRDLKGGCFLTRLTHYLEHGKDIDCEDSDFTSNLASYFNINITQESTEKITHIIIAIAWFFAYYRFTHAFNINVIPHKGYKYLINGGLIAWIISNIISLRMSDYYLK